MNQELDERLAGAREISWAHHGQKLDIHTPGMFVAYGRRGRYPAVSLTGVECRQACQHCRGKLLNTMLPAETPAQLVELGRRQWKAGQVGMLISGGCDPQGRLPLQQFIPAIAELTSSTGLIITAHVGRLDEPTARALKQAGVSQALFDVVGDAQTAREILNLSDGLTAQETTLASCAAAGLEIVPHIILGLFRGHLCGEDNALEIVAGLNPSRVVFVVFMPLVGTPLAEVKPPDPEQVAEFLVKARHRLPEVKHHLGCARPRGKYRQELDGLAVAAGINVLAIPSDGALEMARKLGVDVEYADTCCSLA